jgi:hypothetical protein
MKRFALLAFLLTALTASAAPATRPTTADQDRMRQIVRLGELLAQAPNGPRGCDAKGCTCTGVKGCMDLIASGQCPSAGDFQCVPNGGDPKCVCLK